ncbi:MAG: Hsp20/alpha crystallin family protein [Eubacterium sp.]|nr:Hsp20/alpha crystallin family protein [Eubacterium sp.]
MLMPSIFNNNFVDNFFDDMFRWPTSMRKADSSIMRTDVRDLGDSYELSMELAGYSKDDIKAELKDGIMTITATKNENNDEKDTEGNYIRRERYYGTCQRSFQVGDALTEEDIHAEFKDGILKITLPKEKEKPAVEEKKYIAIQ